MQTETHRAASFSYRTFKCHRRSYLKKSKTLSLQAKSGNILFSPKQEKRTCTRRALPCVFQRGSLTAEAALVVPFFFLLCMTLYCFAGEYAVQTEVTAALEEAGELAGMYAAVSEEIPEGSAFEGISSGISQGAVLAMARQKAAETAGVSGLWLGASTMEETKLRLCASYSYTPALSLPAVWGFSLTAAVELHPWTGDDGDWPAGDFAGEAWVYVSDNRSVYHTYGDCSYLDITLKFVSFAQVGRLRNAYGARYKACEKCTGELSENTTVYISEKGDRYHQTDSCSGLARSPEMVAFSEVSDLPLCSRCRARGG